ncbi:MAG: FAD binding domain-containing protein [Aquincola tertiaricarbonis]|uniref:FAD binding domain-containing protein n=1 Tax=Aquincola TaxID=391952 RepID=UPI000A89307C|nr:MULTISPECIES: xanthine dehydrogenase family protein subunit M [Aquincola]MCR5867985.1 xanthine dehydrogenase family protein subunit M [Aquincola sp. J276]
MTPFDHVMPDAVESALADIGRAPLPTPDSARFLAGGTNLLDLMKADLTRPTRLVDVHRLPLKAIEPTADGGLSLGAMATNAETAAHPLVRSRHPLLAAAILAGASPQIRNMATNGGNLLQRTRCSYFYDAKVPCNKREPGSGCPARNGLAKQLAILGSSEQCIATHPSDFCVGLAALDATVHVRSQRGSRRIPMLQFHRLPGDRPELDTELAPDELITHITLPPAPFTRHTTYLKLRERASYAFALVSVAAALQLDERGRITEARIALGGVAHKPWRLPEAEALLQGREATPAAFGEAARRLLQGAQAHGAPGTDNAFKIPLAERAVVRALELAVAGELTNTGPLAGLPVDSVRREPS